MRNWFWGISEATGDLYSHRRRTRPGYDCMADHWSCMYCGGNDFCRSGDYDPQNRWYGSLSGRSFWQKGWFPGWLDADHSVLSCYDRSPFSSICPAGSIVRRGWFDPARSNCSNYYRYHFEWSGLRSRRRRTGSIYRL